MGKVTEDVPRGRRVAQPGVRREAVSSGSSGMHPARSSLSGQHVNTLSMDSRLNMVDVRLAEGQAATEEYPRTTCWSADLPTIDSDRGAGNRGPVQFFVKRSFALTNRLAEGR